MQSWLEGRNWVGKCAQATGMTASLRILSSKEDSNTWKSIQSHHAQTSSGKGLPSHFWNRNIIRSIFPGLRRKITGLLLSVPKPSFQMKVNFAFNLGIKVPESGGRVERHRIHVAWSPVWRFHSQWWFGLPCHRLVLVHCVFWSPQSTQPSTRKCLSTSCFLLLTSFIKMLISFFSRIWHLPTLSKVPKAGSMTMVLLCFIGQQTRLTWIPMRLYGLLSRGRWETPDSTM